MPAGASTASGTAAEGGGDGGGDGAESLQKAAAGELGAGRRGEIKLDSYESSSIWHATASNLSYRRYLACERA